jgi:hypothetical protein
VTAILASLSTKVLLNGRLGDGIHNAKGLRQGDSLSPLLFVLLMEVLSTLIRLADSWSLLAPLHQNLSQHRASLYADDLVIFLSPMEHDFWIMRSNFDAIREASGLACNIAKTQMVAIRCDEEQLALATSLFPCQAFEFPIKYLGIPLSTHKLPRSAFQLLIDKMPDKLLAWKGDQMNHSGRLTLIKSTLSTMPIHTALSVDMPLG